jgi:hypothetical protein
MDEHDPDIERTQDCDIQQDVGEILIRDDRPINAEDESLFPELRNVLQDAPQISEFHGKSNLA